MLKTGINVEENRSLCSDIPYQIKLTCTWLQSFQSPGFKSPETSVWVKQLLIKLHTAQSYPSYHWWIWAERERAILNLILQNFSGVLTQGFTLSTTNPMGKTQRTPPSSMRKKNSTEDIASSNHLSKTSNNYFNDTVVKLLMSHKNQWQ